MKTEISSVVDDLIKKSESQIRKTQNTLNFISVAMPSICLIVLSIVLNIRISNLEKDVKLKEDIVKAQGKELDSYFQYIKQLGPNSMEKYLEYEHGH